MPTVLRVGPFRFFFYAGDGSEPPHVHVERDDCEAKVWLDPVRLERSRGFNPKDINRIGDLPEGNHSATFEDVVARFGSGSTQRQAVTDRLRWVYRLALATNYLDRLLVFGSYVSQVSEPNDVDVILVMRNEFRSEDCPAESSVLFDHARANDELGASVFWIRPNMLLSEPREQFLAFWQTKRDGQRRGVVEIQA